MMTVSAIVFLLVVTLVAGAVLYNRLVGARNQVRNAWSDIDVQLQRRHDLIPRLVAAVDQYAKYERASLEAITELRAEAISAADIETRGEIEERLSSGLQRIIALAENYPDLKANENFLKLQGELVETEDFLQFARRYYNGSVRNWNNLVETFPSRIIAGMSQFTLASFFEIEQASERLPPSLASQMATT